VETPWSIVEGSTVAHKKDRVVMAYCTGPEVTAPFCISKANLLMHDVNHQHRIVDGGGLITEFAGVNVAGPRNTVVRKFLAKSKADWLWMIDTDMSFPPDTLDRLLEYADKDEAPIVGALCFGIDGDDLFPTLYDLTEHDGSPRTIRYWEYPEQSMFQVTATGAACMLVHRRVFEAILERSFSRAFPWFQETEMDGNPVGEDVTFCIRAGLCEFPVFVNTSVTIGHQKPTVLTEDKYLAQRPNARRAAPTKEAVA
jgi:hypothetical protein